ncbi:MAG: hypothetical protein Q9167_006226 [Letrouitia subvulpina]
MDEHQNPACPAYSKNILIYSSKPGSKNKFNFTCCDIEPAILARNIILFTLIVDQNPNTKAHIDHVQSLWNIFYHIFIPEKSFKILQEQAVKLLDASKSLEQWALSSYGKFTLFLNKDTLKQLREYWTRYSDEQLPVKHDQSARNAMFSRSKENRKSLFVQGIWSAGPLWSDGLDIMDYLFHRYWETGIAGGNSEDLEQLGPRQKGILNPMFAISSAPSGEFAVHCGTEPLLGFHLAPAFQSMILGQSLSAEVKRDRLVKAAKQQFRDWCSTFQALVKKNQVCLQIICCDAITLCFEYQLEIALEARSRELAMAYVKPWSSCPLVLDGQLPMTSSGKPAIRKFDVIDTSNLGDHVGIINIITSCTPLLRSTHTASLCTESLLAASENPTTSLSSALGSDVATFSLVVGLVPTGLFNRVTMDGVCNEAMLQTLFAKESSAAQKQYRLRIHWKSPLPGQRHARSSGEGEKGLGQRVRFEPEDLATYLFGIYKKMFAHEDITSFFARAQRMKSSTFSTDMQRYTRASTVALLRLVKSRSITDWEELMSRFLNKIEGDQSLIVGSNSFQELYMHLTVFSVWTNPALAKGPRQLQDRLGLPLRSRSGDEDLLGEENVPPIIQIVLVVPRERLKPFTSQSPDLVGTPGIHVSVKQSTGQVQYENHFYSFHCCCGKFEFDQTQGTASTFEEDEKGWLGTADLIIICPVPAFGLLTGPRKGLKVALVLNNNPENMARFTQTFGMMMVVFETNFDNRKRAFVCKNAPKLDSIHSYSMQKRWMEATVKKNLQDLELLAKMHMSEKVHSL